MIELIPAIDIINGQCVRLVQGDFSRSTLYDPDPVRVARSFAALGFRRLHLVDLDGARKGNVVNWPVLAAIAAATDLEIDCSGGIKTAAEAQLLLGAGARWLGVGSIAVTQPDLFGHWLEQYGPDTFIVAADVAAGQVVINGWQQSTTLSVYDLIGTYYEQGLRRFCCTDISKDGMLGGPATEWYEQLLKRFPDLYLIASGGVSSIADIAALEQAGCSGVIIGKALYEGRISAAALGKWL